MRLFQIVDFPKTHAARLDHAGANDTHRAEGRMLGALPHRLIQRSRIDFQDKADRLGGADIQNGDKAAFQGGFQALAHRAHVRNIGVHASSPSAASALRPSCKLCRASGPRRSVGRPFILRSIAVTSLVSGFSGVCSSAFT